MAAYFAAAGDVVEVITAPPYYPQWEVQAGYGKGYRKEVIDGVTVLRCPLYVPKEVSGLKRILHEVSFVASSLRYWIPRYFRSYDLILCISPPFHLGFLALPHKWLRGTPVINHIQDLQVDAARDLGMIRQEGLLWLLEKFECWLMKKVTNVSTISSGMVQKIVKKGIQEKNIITFPNWVDKTLVYPVPKADSARTDWGFDNRDRIVLYAGNLGEKQGLENVLLVAERLRGVPRLTFLIVGEGGAKSRLMAEAARMGLRNVVFKPLQPLARLAASLAAADIHLVLQKKAAADLVMPSKLTNILAVGGHALVTAEPGTTLYDLVQDNQLGTTVDPENLDALEQGIREILSGQREADYRGARAFAAEYLDKENILLGFRQILTQNTKQHNSWKSLPS